MSNACGYLEVLFVLDSPKSVLWLLALWWLQRLQVIDNQILSVELKMKIVILLYSALAQVTITSRRLTNGSRPTTATTIITQISTTTSLITQISTTTSAVATNDVTVTSAVDATNLDVGPKIDGTLAIIVLVGVMLFLSAVMGLCIYRNHRNRKKHRASVYCHN